MKIWVVCAAFAQICGFPVLFSRSAQQWDYGSGSGDYALKISLTIQERDISSDYYGSYVSYNYSGAEYDEHKVFKIIIRSLNFKLSHLHCMILITDALSGRFFKVLTVRYKE